MTQVVPSYAYTPVSQRVPEMEGVHARDGGGGGTEASDVPVVELMYFGFTRMLCESHHRRFRSLQLCPLVHV